VAKGATAQAIRLRQDELDRLRRDIDACEQRLQLSRRQERYTQERLEDYDRQTSLIRRLVSHLNAEVTSNQQDIGVAQAALREAETELARVQERYRRAIVAAYKQGRAHDTELLLSAASLNQMYLRARYLRAVTEQQRRYVEAIRERRSIVEARKSSLQATVQRQEQALSAKAREEQRLVVRTAEQKEVLVRVRNDKAEQQKELRRKQAAAAQIERLISDLIERERQRALASRGGSGGKRRGAGAAGSADVSTLPGKPISQTAFGRLKGRLPWPVAQGAVVGNFGEQVNPRLNTVTISNGIDIKAAGGAAVRAVADGTVKIVNFIPGFGSVLIIDHNDGFFTVYAHIGVRVSLGQRVKAGQTIGTVAEGLSGPIMHFQLWRQRAKQNPLSWLSGR
jgi:septal ring factor EnvC (AmiA/AmiB activator)